MTSLPTNNYEGNDTAMFRSCMVQSRHSGNGSNHFLPSRGTEKAERKFSMSLSTPQQSKEANKDSFVKTVWEIGSIDTLPNAANIFPLERSRVSVNGGVSPNTIGQRIVDCLKYLSITIVSKRRYKLVAESLDCDVRFNIKLYKEKYDCDDVSSSEGYRVMVELQKKSGCSINFASIARTILQMAESGKYNRHYEEDILPPCGSPLSPPPNKQAIEDPLALALMRYRSSIEMEEENISFLSLDLKRTAASIRSNRMDLSLLGMKKLVFLTSTHITSNSTALFVAKLVLGNDVVDSKDDSLDLSSLIKSFVSVDICDEEDVKDNTFFGEYVNKMHYYALTVLANSMHVVWSSYGGEFGYLQQILCTDGWLEKKHGLLPRLIDKLVHSEKRPYDAYQVMRCLNVVFQVSSPKVNLKAMEWGAMSAIYSARDIGHSCHSLLERESELAMKTLINAI
mmetsp:Transcript_58529/g.87145  ORF Transcript_58529/g.87145 Transcript_58529/m.87145 type:complete len:453 (+) Transcript_58529:191-1549(+)